MTRTHGRSYRGTPLVKAMPNSRWRTTTFLGAMTARGFVTPLRVDGSVSGLVFRAWMEQHLAPALRLSDVAVMENLSSQKVRGVRKAIEAIGTSALYLPAYSPDLKPDRAGTGEVQKTSAGRCGPDEREAVAAVRPCAGTVLGERMPAVHPALRLPLSSLSLAARADRRDPRLHRRTLVRGRL